MTSTAGSVLEDRSFDWIPEFDPREATALRTLLNQLPLLTSNPSS